MKKIFIVDYGLGNIHSAEQSLKKVVKDKKDLATVKVANNANDINDATHIILPGQGAFSSCMEGLKNIPGMIDELNKNILIKKKPFLGICVGMQLLAETSFENGNHKGLGWIEGEIKKIPQKNLKLPHMGWNEITIEKKNSLIRNKKTTNYYFVHSYFFECKYEDDILATTDYGTKFTSAVCKNNIYGVQFHPEKSSFSGLELLSNFINL
tara:strand:+ start:1198 stop:1827 length:630 start_codon:yes stop_codon:yes gene_type:complete